MLKIVFTVALIVTFSVNALPKRGSARNGRILGGALAEIEYHPWQVSIGRLLANGYGAFIDCGGSIIAADWVLTAAHCVIDKLGNRRQITHVFPGSASIESGPSRLINYIKCHDHFAYVSGLPKNDIALLHVSEPFEFNDATQMIPLFRSFSSPATEVHGQNVNVSGFGLVGSERTSLLHSVELTTMDQNDCDFFMSSKFNDHFHRHGNICVNNTGTDKAACRGDSGGPVTRNFPSRTYLVGIVSFGGSESSTPCGSGYNAFTDVSFFYNWIFDEIAAYYSVLYRTDYGTIPTKIYNSELE